MKFSEKLTYCTLTAVCGTMSLLPLRVLYILSDCLAWIAHHVVKYRLKVVRSNLATSFPEKDEKELRRITSGFYHFLCDCFVESVKLYSMSADYMRRHLTIEGIEPLNDATAAGRNVSIMLGHYCNWEWVSSLPLHLLSCAVPVQIYHPLRNRGSDKFFARLRTRFHAVNIPMHETFATLMRYRKEGKPTVTGYIADQAPSLNVHLFVDFLNHDTNAYTGPERISRLLDAEVYYAHMSRPRRGYYTLRFIPITRDIKNTPVFDPSKEYFKLLEANIREAPQYWLWSHRRWKRTRERFNALYGDKAAERCTHL